MDLLETRDLVYFVAVAERLHFGRAAREVGIAQPALSRAIARLERRLGVRLLERDSRRVELTPAGAVLLREARRALEAVAGAARRTRRAGDALVIARKAGADAGIVDRVVREFTTVAVQIVHTADERRAMLRDGRADLAVLHRPNNDLTGLRTLDLRTETRVAVLAADHPLAARGTLSTADLAGESVPRWPESAPGAADGPLVRDTGQLTHLAVTERAVALIPASAVGQIPRSLACVPVVDADPITAVLAWLPGTESPALTAFLDHARTVVDRLDREGHEVGGLTTSSGRVQAVP